MTVRILCCAGSARRDSPSNKPARFAAAAVRQAGGESTFVDLDDYPLPIDHGNVEADQAVPGPTGLPSRLRAAG